MTTQLLFKGGPNSWKDYEIPLSNALKKTGQEYHLAEDISPEHVDYIVYAPSSGLSDFKPYTRCKAVLCLWAGVETIIGNKSLTMPLTRMVDSGMTQGMVEWVTGHVLRHHLGTDAHVLGQDGLWRSAIPPLAKDRTVTILGLGALGAACATTLAGLGFSVRGWSRGPKIIENIATFHGSDGFNQALQDTEITVLLLPSTPETANILNADAFSKMAPGAFVINPGRGPLIEDDALLQALHSGQLGHATLDVFREEPLPVTHQFWAHPKITVTPHIASATRIETACTVIVENIQRGEASLPFLHLADAAAGY